jgi:hypothetical protein
MKRRLRPQTSEKIFRAANIASHFFIARPHLQPTHVGFRVLGGIATPLLMSSTVPELGPRASVIVRPELGPRASVIVRPELGPRASVIAYMKGGVMCTDIGNVRGMVHDEDEGMTYLAQREYGGVRRICHDTGVSDVFCAIHNIRSIVLVPRDQRTPDRYLVCCVATAVYLVSKRGVAKLLSGNAWQFGNIDAKVGAEARFSHIRACVFDLSGRLVIREHSLTGFSSRLRLVDMDTGAKEQGQCENVVGAFQFRCAHQNFASLTTRSPTWSRVLPAQLNTHVGTAVLNGILFDDANDRAILVTNRQTFATDANNAKTVLFDADASTIDVPVHPPLSWSSASSTAPDPHVKAKKPKPRFRPNLTLPLLVADRGVVPTLCIRIREATLWPPGLAEIVANYSSPGLSLLCVDTSNRQLVSIPANSNF